MLPATISSRGSRSSRQLLHAATTLVLALALAAPANAAAKKVAVIDFKGPAAKAEKAVVKALKDEGFQIVGPTNWQKAERKAKAKGRSEKALAKTAAKAGVAAIVIGKIQKKGKKNLLVLQVHDGKSGTLLETVEIPLKGAAVDKKAEAAIAQDLAPVVRRGEAAGGDEGGDEKPVRGAREETARREEPKEELPRREEPVERRGEPTGDVDVKKKKEAEPGEGDKRDFFTAGAGMSLWARRMSITPDQAADTYKGQPVPGLRIDAEVYPAAPFVRNAAADFGIGFMFDMIWLKSELSSGGSKLSTKQMQWGVDLRWRWKLLDSQTSPVLKAALQFSSLSFTIDRGATTGLNIPDVKYMSVAPVVGMVFPLGTKMFQLGATVGFPVAISYSGTPDNTTKSGTPWGVEVGVNFDFYPLPWLLTRAQFGMVRYAVKFTPDTAAGATATGMADMYLGGMICAGYVWH